MSDARLASAAGACAVVGGLALTAAVVLHALQPEGCVGDQCLIRPQREATGATSWLVLLTAAAMVAFVVTLFVLLGRTGRLGRVGTVGIAACVLGVAALASMTLPPLRGHTRPLPALVAVALGLVLVGWTVLRSRVVPTWAAVGLLVGVLLLAGVSEQTSRVLLALPFAIAWAATGVALVRQARAP